MAKGEYDMLRTLQRLDIPCVEPVAVITNRTDDEGEALKPVLVTRHLKFSLPYRALFSQTLRPDTATRLVDALAVLLVRLHIVGFFWGDVSLSNTLFRRDAGAFAAYLVDAETGKLYEGGLSNGQRENDLEIARVNIAGELLDLEAGGRVADELDPVNISNGIVAAYRSLWKELTGAEIVLVGRALAHQRARRPPQRPRLRHRGARDQDRRDGHDRAHPAEGRRRRAPPAPPAAPHRPRRRREPGAPPAQRPRLVPRGLRQGTARRGDGRARVAHARVRAGRARDPARPAGQARAGRGLPPAARAPLVHVAAGGARHPARRGGHARTSTRSSGTAATRRP